MMLKFKQKDYASAIYLGEQIIKSQPSLCDAYYIVGLSASMLD